MFLAIDNASHLKHSIRYQEQDVLHVRAEYQVTLLLLASTVPSINAVD